MMSASLVARSVPDLPIVGFHYFHRKTISVQARLPVPGWSITWDLRFPVHAACVKPGAMPTVVVGMLKAVETVIPSQVG